MPQTRTTTQTTYQFDELDDAAKERARDWYRSCPFDNDFDCKIEEFVTIGEIIGITFDRRIRRHIGAMSTDEGPKIYWSLSYSQGDGACFEGTYAHTADSCAKIREHAPQDEELHRIADELNRIQSARILLGKSTWAAGITKIDHHYCHENTVSIDVTDAEEDEDEPLINADVDKIEELMRDLMRWLHKQLRDQSDYLYSAEHVDEVIVMNEYEFDEEGHRI